MSGSLSKYGSEYYSHLQAVRDRGEWEDWLKFFLRGVREIAQEASETGRKIVNMKEEHRQLVLQKMGRRSGNALTLLESLYFKPIITVENVAEIIHISYPNANTLVKALCELNILKGTSIN